MLRWPNNQGVMGDDPPYLVVGTEVSAKYKGAFCEAKVRKVVRSVKCKVNFKLGLGTAVVTDDQIRGTVRVGSVVEVKHADRKEYVEAHIAKIQDCSQYTVVFDDGDITTLRRTALCLKSGRHFAESETLDQLPLTHPEHFGNPVVGNRRGGRRSRNPMSDDSSDEEEEPPKGKLKEEKEADIGKVICVELSDKKKQKDNWFPGLVVAPTAQEVVRIRVKDEYLVRSFKDGRYFTVPKKEALEFTREIGSKVDNNTLKTAVDKALQYLDKDELPPHWDRELLFGLDDASTASDSDAAFESDSSDDEPREEKDHFVAQLYKFMDDRGTPINRGPAISGRDIDLYKLFKVVHKLGGYNRVTNHSQWKMVSHKLGFGLFSTTANLVKVAYKKYLHSFEDFYRKLGCTMVNHPRGNRSRHRGGRSLIRDKDRATPVNVPRAESKDKGSEVDDDEDQPEKGEESAECSMDDKEEELSKRREGKSKEKEDSLSNVKKNNEKSMTDVYEKDERPQRLNRDVRKDERPPRKDDKSSNLVTARDPEVITKSLLAPPLLERKPSDPQLKVSTPKGKPKRLADGSASKSGLDVKKRIVVTKLKASKAVGDEDDEMEELDVEELEDEDDDKLTTTRSKAKEEFTRLKADLKSSLEPDKKSRVVEVGERKLKPSLTATAEKRSGRPVLTAASDKKLKPSVDSDRKTVRSLAAEFEKKARGLETDKKESSCSDADNRKSRSYSVGDSDKKIRPSLTATLEKKKSSIESDKKSRQGGTDSEKKIRPSLTADLERKKVRPSLTADPTKKVSRLDSEKKRENDRKNLRPSDTEKDEGERKTKIHDAERKVNTPDSGKLSSAGDSDRKSSKSDSGDSEKRSTLKSKKGDDDKRKLQVRKRKDNDDNGGSSVDDSLDQLASYKNVCVGDKLKVYYGPTHESKVTYEAKVLEVEGEGQDESYLVHYTGWNNRYDEWIKRSRIADNLSWSPARGKRRHQTQLTGVKRSSGKRRTLTPARDGASPLLKDQAMPSLPGGDKSRDSQPPRSSTPSSVTSSSSRTKSPAMRPSSARVTRNTVGEAAQLLLEQSTRRTRTRRFSGQTDVPSESESEASGSESEAEPSAVRKSSRRLASEKEEDSSRKESAPKRKQRKRDTEAEVDEEEDKEGDKDDVKDDAKDDDDASSESPSEDKLPMKRTRKGTRSIIERKTEVKAEVEEEIAPPSQSTKGKDFDLNQIRSELKGIDKAVKASSPSGSDKEHKNDSDDDLDPNVDVADPPDKKSCTLLGPEETAIDMEDIYEFKEPEPFEFEVRTKREPSVERTGKLQKRPLPRIFDDVEPVPKKKAIKPSVGDSESSEEGSPKRKFRRPVGKKDDSEVKIESESPPPELFIEKASASDQLTPQKKTYSVFTDDAFEKLRQSPSYRFSAGSPIRATTPTPLSLSPVPVPMQSPPQSSSSISSVITSGSSLPLSRSTMSTSSATVSQLCATKAVPVLITKPSSVQPLKPALAPVPVSAPSLVPAISPASVPEPEPAHVLTPMPGLTPALVSDPDASMKHKECKDLAVVKPVQPSSSTVTAVPSRPPVLAAVVNISSETCVITKTEEWLKCRQPAPEKSDLSKVSKEEQVIKIEKDDTLPPLVPTALSVPVAGRTSPEPPQLLPMSGPAPKVSYEQTKPEEAKDVPMPQIKKESLPDPDPIIPCIPQVGQSVSAPPSPETPVLEEHHEEIPEEDTFRRTGRRKAQIKRKKAVSKEFVEDSDSDSSDEERRLVIDKSESSDSSSESAETKSVNLVKDHESKWHTAMKDDSSLVQKSNPPKKDDFISFKLKDPLSVSSSVDSATEDTLSAGKAEDPEEPEADSNLCSLLCEETIPGSPAPPSDVSIDVHSELNTSVILERPTETSKTSCKVLEMPFASVPGNTRSSGPSTTTNAGAAQCSKSTSPGEKSESAVSDSGASNAGPSSVSIEAAPVMDNTPPTTPDSSISTLSNSPRGEHGDSLSILDNDSTKSHRDSEDADNKDNDFSDDDLDVGSRMKRLSAEKKDSERVKDRCDTDLSPSKKRRRSRKGSESEDRSKRARHSTSRLPGRGAASDSDENTESSTPVTTTSQSQSQPPSQPPTLPSSLSNYNSQSQASRSPRPSKYNFFVELAPELDASQRIALLQQTLQELRKTYASVKQQLACIDRRRKKLRRREREARLEARKMMREERKQAREELVSCS